MDETDLNSTKYNGRKINVIQENADKYHFEILIHLILCWN